MGRLEDCLQKLGIDSNHSGYIRGIIKEVAGDGDTESSETIRKALQQAIGLSNNDRQSILQQIHDATTPDVRSSIFPKMAQPTTSQQGDTAWYDLPAIDTTTSQADSTAPGAPAATPTDKPPDNGLMDNIVNVISGLGEKMRGTETDLAGYANQPFPANSTPLDNIAKGGSYLLGTAVGTAAQIPEIVGGIGHLMGFGDTPGGGEKPSAGNMLLDMARSIPKTALDFPAVAQGHTQQLLEDIGVSRETAAHLASFTDPIVNLTNPAANFYTDLTDGTPGNSISDEQYLANIKGQVSERPSMMMDFPSQFVPVEGVGLTSKLVRKIRGGAAVKAAAESIGILDAAAAEELAAARAADHAAASDRVVRESRFKSPSESGPTMYIDAGGNVSTNIDEVMTGRPTIDPGVNSAVENLAKGDGYAQNSWVSRRAATEKKLVDGTEPLYTSNEHGEVLQTGEGTPIDPTAKPTPTGKTYMKKLTKNLKNPIVLGLGVYGAANIVNNLTKDEPKNFESADALNLALLGAVAMAPTKLVSGMKTTIGERLRDINPLLIKYVAGGQFGLTTQWGIFQDMKNIVGDKEIFPGERYADRVEALDVKTHQAHSDIVVNLERTSKAFRKFVSGLGFSKEEWTAANKHIVEAGVTQRLGAEEAAKWLEQSGGQVRDISGLTSKERALYQYSRGMFDQGIQEINNMRVNHGLKPINVKPDYWTLFSSAETRAAIDVPDGAFHKIGGEVSEASFPFRESGGVPHKIDLDFGQTIERYFTSQKSHVHLTPVLQDADALFNAMKKDGLWNGKEGKMVNFQRWMRDAAGLTDDLASPGTRKVLNSLMKNNSLAQLGYNAGSIVTQFTSLPMVVNAIGARGAIEGIAASFEDAIKHGFDPIKSEAVKKSRLLRGRIAEVGVGEAFVALEHGNTEKFATLFMKRADEVVARTAWHGAYKRGIRMGWDEGRAIKYADDVVLRTQGDASKLFTSAIQHRTLGKLLTQFATFTINNFNYLKREAFSTGQNTLKGSMSKTRAYSAMLEGVIATYAMNQLYQQALGTSTNQFDPINAGQQGYEKSGWGGVLPGIAANAQEQVPILSSTKYSNVGIGGAVISNLANTAKSLAPAMSGDSPNWINFGEGVGKAVGVPGTSQIARVAREGHLLHQTNTSTNDRPRRTRPTRRKRGNR